ncbi:hypothetical protein V8C44DRAFT_102515 [Trichoderma aethiopicum]
MGKVKSGKRLGTGKANSWALYNQERPATETCDVCQGPSTLRIALSLLPTLKLAQAVDPTKGSEHVGAGAGNIHTRRRLADMTSMVPHHASHRVLHPKTSLADSEIVLLCTNTTEAHNAGQLTGLQYGRGCCSRPYAKGGIGNGALVQLFVQPFSEYVAGTRRVGHVCVYCVVEHGVASQSTRTLRILIPGSFFSPSGGLGNVLRMLAAPMGSILSNRGAVRHSSASENGRPSTRGTLHVLGHDCRQDM